MLAGHPGRSFLSFLRWWIQWPTCLSKYNKIMNMLSFSDMYGCVCMCLCLCLHAYACMHVYFCVYVYYVNTYIWIYVHLCHGHCVHWIAVVIHSISYCGLSKSHWPKNCWNPWVLLDQSLVFFCAVLTVCTTPPHWSSWIGNTIMLFPNFNYSSHPSLSGSLVYTRRVEKVLIWAGEQHMSSAANQGAVSDSISH